MPVGGEKIEVAPSACPSGHPWPDRRPRGREAPVLVGHHPCSCPASGGHGHRYYHCETKGCSTPWTLRPPCDEPSRDSLGITAHRSQ